jgi:hypothetical protein
MVATVMKVVVVAVLAGGSLTACGNDSEEEVPLYAAPALYTDDLCGEISGVSALASTTDKRWVLGDRTAGESSTRFENVKQCDIKGRTPTSSFTIHAEVASYGARSAEIAERNASELPEEACNNEISGDMVDGVCHMNSDVESGPYVTLRQHVVGTSIVVETSVTSPNEADLAAVTNTADEVLQMLNSIAERTSMP